MPGDLHTHTTFSDGSTPADKLPFLAACAGMTHLAISDHDSIRSVRYAYAHPVQNGVHLIPATELTAYDYERAHRVHLLCYWPDDCAALADFSAMMAERRMTAMLQSCKELEAICPQFRTEEALELAKDSGTLFKAQVMRVLWQYGLADGMYNTVYKSLFGLKPVRGRILHTPRYEPVDTVLDVIKASRAVVVLAHPSVYHSMELARELIAAGVATQADLDAMTKEIKDIMFETFKLAIDDELSPRMDLHKEPELLGTMMFSNQSIDSLSDAKPDVNHPMSENPRVQQIAKKERFAFDKDGKPFSKMKQFQLRDGIFEAIIDRFYKDASLIAYGEENRDWGGAFAVYRGLTEALRTTACLTPRSPKRPSSARRSDTPCAAVA